MTNQTDLENWRKDIKFNAKLNDIEFKFNTTWGIFSPTEIDTGTNLLIKELDFLKEDFQCLDIGCGYGPLGLYLAKKCPGGIIHMVDRDYIAVEYSKINAKKNLVNNTSIYLSNGFSEVPKDEKFDLIVCNIPAKIGRQLTELILFDASSHLRPDGRIYLVGIIGLKEFIKTNLTKYFGNYKKVAMSQHYYIAYAVK